jgi:hypothetical protein
MVLTPFVANTSTIDYQTKASAKLWKQSSKGLYGDSEELWYNLTTECLMSFLDDLTNQAKKCGWLVLMQITKDGETKSICGHLCLFVSREFSCGFFLGFEVKTLGGEFLKGIFCTVES